MGRGGAHWQGLNLSRRLNGLVVQKQAKYLDFLHHSAGSRLVCVAWRSRPIAMASGRRIVYPWQ